MLKALLKRARLYLETEQFDEAVRDFDTASKADSSNRGCPHTDEGIVILTNT